MNLLVAYKRLQRLAPLFKTEEVAMELGVTKNNAAAILSRLAKHDMIIQLARGRWAYSESVDPLLIPSFLVEPMIAYASLYTALYYHDMIEQIPSTVYAIALCKTKQFNTLLGCFSIHSILPDLFTGYQLYGNNDVLMATPEKALFDTFYLTPAKSSLFKRLTEIELPQGFRFDVMEQWLQLVKNKSRRRMIDDKISLVAA